MMTKRRCDLLSEPFIYAGAYICNSNSLPLWVRYSKKRRKLKNTLAASKLNVMLRLNLLASQPKLTVPFPRLSLALCGPHLLVIHQTLSGSGPNLVVLWQVAA